MRKNDTKNSKNNFPVFWGWECVMARHGGRHSEKAKSPDFLNVRVLPILMPSLHGCTCTAVATDK